MAATSDRLGKMRQSEISLGGRVFQNCNVMTEALNEVERNYERYGLDTNLQDRELVDGTLTLRGIASDFAVEVQAMLAGYNPDTPPAVQLVDSGHEIVVPAWRNMRNPEDNGYIRSRYFGKWNPSAIATEQGAINDPSMPEFTGKTDRPVEVNGGFIYGQLKAAVSGSSGYTATFTGVMKIADMSGYALDLYGLTGTATNGGQVRTCQFNRGAALVASNGAVIVNGIDAADIPKDWGVLTSLYAVLVGTGTYLGNNLPVTAQSIWSA